MTNLQIIVEFVAQVNAGKFDQILSQMKAGLEGLGDVDFEKDIEQEITNIQKAFDGLDLDALEKELNAFEKKLENMNVSEIDKALSDLGKDIDLSKLDRQLAGLSDVDLGDVSEKLQDTFNNFDTLKSQKQVGEVAEAFKKSKVAAEQLLENQRLALASLQVNGKKGTDEYKKLEAEIKQTEKQVKEMDKAVDAISKKKMSPTAKFDGFNEMLASVTAVSNSFNEVIAVGSKFQDALLSVQAITGQTDQQMQVLGNSAKDLSNKFGGSASDQLKSFGGILSKFGADVAKQPAALASLADSVNVLSAASGDDAATSMSALTDSMLQFGLLDDKDPSKTAANAVKTINALAASAQVGAAEIPQVAQSILATGVAARGANLSLEQTAAAIQILSVGGKTGSEAGIGLRNVLGLLQKASGPAAEALQKMGTSSKELGELLTTKGLDAALGKLKVGMDGIASDAERNTALMTIFGTENSAAAGILLGNLDKFGDFQKGITDAVTEGADNSASAYAQAAIRMNSTSTMIAKAKSVVENSFISLFDTIGNGAATAVGSISQIAPTVAGLSGIKALVPSSVTDGTIAKIGEVTKKIKGMIPPGITEQAGKLLKGVGDKVGGLPGILSKVGPALLNPYALGFAAVAGGLTYFFTQTDKGKEIFAAFEAKIGAFLTKFEPLFKKLGDIGGAYIGILVQYGRAIFEWVITPFEIAFEILGAVAGMFFSVGDGVSDSSSALEGAASALDVITNVLKFLGDALEKGVDGFVLIKTVLLNFIGGSQEILGAFVEYAKVAINPVNWITGDASAAGDKLKATLSSAMNKAVNGAVRSIQSENLNKALADAVQIKGEVDKAGKLKELSKKFKDAKTDIEREDIAKKIQEQVPGAVKEIGKVVDETGKIITQYEVSSDAVDKFASAQEKAAQTKLGENTKDVVLGIKAQAAEYEDLKNKQIAMQNEIVKQAAAGKDTTVLEQRFATVFKKTAEQGKKVSESISKAADLKIPITTIELPPNATKEFGDQIEKIKTTARQAEIGKSLTDTVQLKEDLDKNHKVEGLLAKLSTAKTQAEKDSIARQIQSEMPGAVESIITGVDANGQLTKSLQVNTTKVKENTEASKERLGGDLLKKQQEFSQNLTDEGKSYQENITKAKELANEIKKKKTAGVDTTALEKDLTAVQEKVASSRDKVLEFGKSYEKIGLDGSKSIGDIAKALGISEAEAKKLRDAQQGATDEAKKTLDAVKALGEAYKEAQAAAKAGVDTKREELAGLLLEQQQILKNKNLTKEQKDEQLRVNKTRSDTVIKDGQAQAASFKNLAAIQKKTESIISTEDKAGKDAFEKAKKLFEQKSKTLDIHQKTTETLISATVVEEERDRNAYDDLLVQKTKLETIQKQKTEFDEQFKSFMKIKENGEIEFSTKLKPEQKEELKDKIETFKANIAETTNTIKEVNLKIKIDKKELDKRITELQIKNIEMKISFGLADKSDIIPLVQKQLDGIAQLREDNVNKITKTEEDYEKRKAKLGANASENAIAQLEAEFGAKRQALDKDFLDLQSQYVEKQTNLRAAVEDVYKQQVDDFKNVIDKQKNILNDTTLPINIRIQQTEEETQKQIRKIQSDEESKIKTITEQLEKKVISQEKFETLRTQIVSNARSQELRIEREAREGIERILLESTQQFITIESLSRTAAAERNKEASLEGIDKEMNAKLKLIDKYKDKQVFTEEELEQKKAAITEEFANRKAAREEEHRIKLLTIQAQADGQEKFLQLAKDKEDLTRQRDTAAQQLAAKKEQIDKLRELGLDTTQQESEALQLESQLASAEDILQQKGTEIGVLATTLQGTVTDTITNLFAGDGNAVADNLRKTLSVIAGALKAKLSAFVLDLVLSPGVSAYLAALPFPLNIAAIPIVTAAVNGAIGAVADPIFNQILSFPTGGKFTEPTLALVGDGARLGGGNTEWLFRDDQLKQVIHSVVMQSNSDMTREMQMIRRAIEEMPLRLTASGEDLRTATNRTTARLSQRSR